MRRITPTTRAAARLAALSMFAVASCGDDQGSPPATAGTSATSDVGPTSVADEGAGAGRCLVRLHGKGGTGGDTIVEGDVTILAPTGNADGWGARQWLYFPDEAFDAASDIVAGAVAGCEQVIVNGFSNGGAFAAKLYCRAETFDERLVGVVVDDPVVDSGVEGCAPDPAVDITLYWTGALEDTAQPGWDCADADWTCEGGATIGIDAFASALGAEVLDSPFDDHQWYLDAPELGAWR